MRLLTLPSWWSAVVVATLTVEVACAGHTVPTPSSENGPIPARELRRMAQVADRFVRALGRGDSSAARSVLADSTELDLYARILAVRDRFIAAWPRGHRVTGSGWINDRADTAGVEFEVPVRSQMRPCYPDGVYDRVTMWFRRRGDQWVICTVSVPLC
jgi:hypothetical protein